MRALVVFYSVAGATRSVAGSIGEGLRASGVDVAEHDLREGRPPDVTECDIVGIGLPVHWFRMATPVRDAMRRHLRYLPIRARIGCVSSSTSRAWPRS